MTNHSRTTLFSVPNAASQDLPDTVATSGRRHRAGNRAEKTRTGARRVSVLPPAVSALALPPGPAPSGTRLWLRPHRHPARPGSQNRGRCERCPGWGPPDQGGKRAAPPHPVGHPAASPRHPPLTRDTGAEAPPTGGKWPWTGGSDCSVGLDSRGREGVCVHA